MLTRATIKVHHFFFLSSKDSLIWELKRPLPKKTDFRKNKEKRKQKKKLLRVPEMKKIPCGLGVHNDNHAKKRKKMTYYFYFSRRFWVSKEPHHFRKPKLAPLRVRCGAPRATTLCKAKKKRWTIPVVACMYVPFRRMYEVCLLRQKVVDRIVV